MKPGTLLVTLHDRSIDVAVIGGASWTLPIGPASLTDRELERADRPAPEQLTNALGIVADHLDDVIRESSMILDAPEVSFAGPAALVVARVELGSEHLPVDYRLERAAADEVFRTLVAEPIDERLHNPGLPPEWVETVIGALCCVLAFMRRLELTDAGIAED